MHEAYIKLTQHGSVHPIIYWIDAYQIMGMKALVIQSHESVTRLELSYSEAILVKETPEQINRMALEARHYA